MDRLRLGLIGCGHIGRRHLEIACMNPRIDVRAVCDTAPAVRERLAAECAGVRVYDRMERMLAAEEFDLVSICTPHYLHASMSIAAARAGVDVLVEKPMALTSEESTKMIRAAAEAGVRLYVVKQNRYNKPVALVQEALAGGHLGRINMVQCNVMWNRYPGYYATSPWRGRREFEGGALHTQVSHFIDLLLWWFGDLEEVKGMTARASHAIEFEDCGVASLRFRSGTLGSLLWTTCVYNVNFEGSITILGECGTIKIGGSYLNEIDKWDVQSFPLPKDVDFSDLPNDYGCYQGSSNNHDLLFDEIIEQFISDRRGVVEGAEGMKTIRAIEQIYGACRRAL